MNQLQEALMLCAIDGNEFGNNNCRVDDDYFIRERRENRESSEGYILRELHFGKRKVTKAEVEATELVNKILKEEYDMKATEQKRTNNNSNDVKSTEQIKDEINENTIKDNHFYVDYKKLKGKRFSGVEFTSYKENFKVYQNGKLIFDVKLSKEGKFLQFTPFEALGWISPSDKLIEDFSV